VKQYQHLTEAFMAHLSVYTQVSSKGKPAELYAPEKYILSLGGKRIRPILSLVACDLFGKSAQQALDAALCVELFHNFSLIHDDILDAAPLRRNKETVHVKWNQNVAILSGDVMLVKAFQVLENYPDKQFKALMSLFTKTAILVCEGQQLDMNFEVASDVKVQDYLEMITKKTAVLLGCSLQMGAIVAEANEHEANSLYEFGKHLGIAFQLLDDLLDVYPHEEVNFGKQVGGDVISNKKTFLLLKAFERAGNTEKLQLEKLLQLNESEAPKKIAGVKEVYDALHIKQLCLEEADKHTNLAIEYLEKIQVPAAKKADLALFAKQLLNRKI
jgi:geranylgeranyl diphosphate synthase, type II